MNLTYVFGFVILAIVIFIIAVILAFYYFRNKSSSADYTPSSDAVCENKEDTYINKHSDPKDEESSEVNNDSRDTKRSDPNDEEYRIYKDEEHRRYREYLETRELKREERWKAFDKRSDRRNERRHPGIQISDDEVLPKRERSIRITSEPASLRDELSVDDREPYSEISVYSQNNEVCTNDENLLTSDSDVETIIVTENITVELEALKKKIKAYKPFSKVKPIPDHILYAEVVDVTKENRPERVARWFLENFFNLKFETNVKPKFLNGLEYDLYNEELGLAVEINGITHYDFPNWACKDKAKFDRQQLNDVLKYDYSDKKGIYLIVVPIHFMSCPYPDIPKWIEYLLPDDLKRWYKKKHHIRSS